LIEELDAKADKTISDQAQLTRLVNEKEAHGLAVKEEVRVIWGDYIKQPQLEKFPQLHGLVHNIMLQASKAKQHVSRDETVKLLSLVNEFADIFWQTKDVETFTATCPYPPSEKVVYPKLSD
jgi:nickel superoxide dismutase